MLSFPGASVTGLGKRWIAGLAALVLLVSAGVTAWFWPRPVAPPSVGRPASVTPVLLPAPGAVAPGVYLLGRTSPAAVYAVETSEGLVLIDSGLEVSATSVLDQLARLGLDVG